MSLIVAGSGHRPKHLPCKYNENDPWIVEILNKLDKAIQLVKPQSIASGMAIGWDMWLAEAALRHNIPLIARIPFPNQHLKWPPKTQQRYKNILSSAKEVECIGPYYSEEYLRKRNHSLVQHCDILWVLWNGDEKTGTGSAIKMAQQQNKVIVNFYE